MLAVFLKPPTIIVIPIVFALYDIYAVFRGPLKSIVNSSDESLDLRPLFVSLGRFNIGTGDLIFYSMIPSSVFLLIGLPFLTFLIGGVSLSFQIPELNQLSKTVSNAKSCRSSSSSNIVRKISKSGGVA